MYLRVATNEHPAPAAPQRFSLGDHLRVWRGYFWHHGIYIGDDRMVQFGGGIFDKRHAGVEEVGLADFLQGGRVEVVPKQQKRIGLPRSPSSSR
ncbi:MAG: lecithin retinol acyltransferase family protein [Solirubrobacteraceae bacterium]